MSKKKRNWILAAAALVLLALGVWRLVPRTVYDVAGLQAEDAEWISVSLHRMYFDGEEEIHTTYQLEAQDNPEAQAALETILADCHCRPSFRNLLPFGNVAYVKGYSEFVAHVTLAGDSGRPAQMFTIWNQKLASLDGKRYFLTDPSLLNRLADLVMTSGTIDGEPILINP